MNLMTAATAVDGRVLGGDTVFENVAIELTTTIKIADIKYCCTIIESNTKNLLKQKEK